MKITDLLEDLKNVCDSHVSSFPREGRMIRTMYASIENTIHASETNNEDRLAAFIQLQMICSQAKEKKEQVMQFTNSIIAADYYFSITKAQKAVPFLNKALEKMADVLEEVEPLYIEDADAFINDFRATNLKEQQSRKNEAVNNVYILNGAAQKIRLELSLSEILMDYVPFSFHIKHFVFTLLTAIASGHFMGFPMVESMAPWRKAIADGKPVSLLEAFVPMDMPYFNTGIILLIITLASIFWTESRSYIRLMSKWAYWKFCR